MKTKISFFLLFLIAFVSCTKDVPEREKKSAKSADEESVRKVIDNYFIAYNAGDIETAVDLLDPNYHGIVSDSIDVIGLDAAREDLLRYNRQYPEGKWEVKIEEITVSDGYSFVLSSGSFLMPNPLKKNQHRFIRKEAYVFYERIRLAGGKFSGTWQHPHLHMMNKNYNCHSISSHHLKSISGSRRMIPARVMLSGGGK